MKISKTFGYLFLIFLLALVLRFIAASYVDVGTDEMIYSIIPLNIISAGRLGTVEQSPLYFYLADVGYILGGGLGQITARLPSIIFGSLAVFLVYLISYGMFTNKKAAYVSSFLWALSGYALQYDSEMDMAAFFFALLSMYLFLHSLKDNKSNFLYLSAASFGLAVMIKNIVLLFIPAYLLVYYLKQRKEKAASPALKPALKKIIISALIFLAVLIPIFSYNYLTYTYSKEGVTDYYFSNMLGIGKTVHSGMESKPWELTRVLHVTKDVFLQLFKWEMVTVLGGFLGTALCFRKKKWVECRNGLLLLWVSLLFLLAYVGGSTGSSTHFLWIPLVLSIFAGYGLFSVHEIALKKFSFTYGLHIILLAAVIINFLFFNWMVQNYASASTVPLWEFAHENIPEDAIVVIDPRIYSGVNAWAFNDRHYLEGMYFPQLMEVIEKSPGTKEEISIYYLECGSKSNYDYCGWKPEDFERIKSHGEKLSDFLVPNMKQIAEINTDTNFILYMGKITAPVSVYNIIDKTHIFWMYPVGWKGGSAVDDYAASGVGVLVNLLGFIVLYLDLLLSLLAIPFVFHLVNKPEALGNKG